MHFKLQEFIAATAEDLNIPLGITEILVSGDLGSRWIMDKRLRTSEVELAMFVKTIRKRLAYEFNNNGILALKKEISNKEAGLKRLKEKYDTFHDLHKSYYNKGNSLGLIKKLLHEDQLIFESGISKERFFQLLPILLLRINPAELELSYLVNTIFRQKIALFLEKETGVKLYVRGSLMFFNSHSFGNGYLGNFCHEEINHKDSDTYFPLQGSDLDVKYSTNLASKNLIDLVEKTRKEINNQFKFYNNYLTIELASVDADTLDSLWEVANIEKLQRIFASNQLFSELKSYGTQYLNKDYQSNYIPLAKYALIEKKKSSNEKNKIMLGNGGILILTKAFELSLRHFRVNKNLSEEFSKRWNNILYLALMETDFFGYIDVKKIFLAFQSIFLFSGYRFSQKEEKQIFNMIINFYFKLRKDNAKIKQRDFSILNTPS